MEIENLEQVKQSLGALIKSLKARDKASQKFSDMGLADYTITRRAAASDKLVSLCQEVDRNTDNLHADLVDAGLAPLNELENYKTRMISVAAGFGHRLDIKYTPKQPKAILNK